jgi:EAL domain-containing protein (putative c-di-GMP-specific phosphodiesterase class I)
LRVEVNTSTAQFKRDDLVSTVGETLAETKLAPGGLGLEMTESLLAADTRATAQALHRLHLLGVQLSIDDFGVGYSSLSYLGHFPFDRLKVDRSFVQGLQADSNNMAIIRAMVGMGHGLGMRILAEGVETIEQWHTLHKEGCDEIQGYLVSRPLPAEELTELLHTYGTRLRTAAG